MQAHLPAEFSREQGCTEAEWLGWLPGAVKGRSWQMQGKRAVRVSLEGGGSVHLAWEPLPPRQIALFCLPRMKVDYRFENATADERREFMRYFDLYMQRGGG